MFTHKEGQQTPSRLNTKKKKNTTRHITIKLLKAKDKEKILKATRKMDGVADTANRNKEKNGRGFPQSDKEHLMKTQN